MNIINSVNTRIYQTIFQVLILISIIVISIGGIGHYQGWIALAISLALEIGRSRYIKSTKEKTLAERDILFRLFFYGIRVIIIILLLIGVAGGVAIVINNDCGTCVVYKVIGLEIIVLWTCVFMGYFIWALYFYNVNLGLTEEEWDKIKDEKLKINTGQLTTPSVQEPATNPYIDQTFGLPPGTVRGMIAFTLLFGAIALVVVSIGMKNTGTDSVMLKDQFEFFKNAFLMMIAFYFGSRSLETLTKGNDGTAPSDISNSNSAPAATTDQVNSSSTVSDKSKADDFIIRPIDPMKN
jgi:hypothetical protein